MADHGMAIFPRLGILLALSAVGCGSVITFSKYSRESGIENYNRGNYVDAEGEFADAIRQNPRDYQSHTYLGLLYDRQKQYANALAHFKNSLEVQPLTEDGQKDTAFRVRTLTAQADTMAKVPGDSAVNDLEARSQSSTTGEEAYQLARVFAGRGDADSAVVAYDRAAQQAPGQFYIAKAQAQYLARQGMKPQAEQAFRRAYRLNDQDPDVISGLRSLGIIPGPSLKDENELKKPLIPVGPLPDILNRNRAPADGAGATP